MEEHGSEEKVFPIGYFLSPPTAGGIFQRGRTREQQESGVRGWCERLDVEESLLRDQCQEFPINKGRLEAAGLIVEVPSVPGDVYKQFGDFQGWHCVIRVEGAGIRRRAPPLCSLFPFFWLLQLGIRSATDGVTKRSLKGSPGVTHHRRGDAFLACTLCTGTLEEGARTRC